MQTSHHRMNRLLLGNRWFWCQAVILWCSQFLWVKASDVKNGEFVSINTDYNLSKEKLRSLEEKASKGDADAAYWISRFYEYTVNDETAWVKWLRRAEDLGHAPAAYNLASYYRYLAKPPDYKTALEIYRKLAEQKNDLEVKGMGEIAIRAMREMGEMFEEGLGVSKDAQKAMDWYEKAARSGKVFTMEKLSGMLFERGNFLEAYQWAELAALRERRKKDEVNEIDTSKFARKLTEEQRAKAKKKVEELDKEIPSINLW